MKKILIILLISFAVLMSSAWAQRRPRLAFEGGDLMIYFVTGYPKLVDMNLYDLGTEKTALPPLGGGLQISFINYMSVGVEALYTYQDINVTTRRTKVEARKTGGKTISDYKKWLCTEIVRKTDSLSYIRKDRIKPQTV